MKHTYGIKRKRKLKKKLVSQQHKNFSLPIVCSYVFWIGDLNFRLMEGLTANDIDLLVKQNQLNVLLEKDQLKTVMANGEAFAELIENKISFPPTYKYEFGSQNYDLKYVIIL